MKPELAAFFAGMGRYLEDPRRGTAPLREAFPAWEAPESRVAVYGRFVRGHVRTAMEKIYPLVRGAVTPAEWDRLVDGYYESRPARHFEPNRAAEAFPAFLTDQAQMHVAPWLPALARFEWADFEVFASEESLPSRVEALTPNPTLTALQHPFRLCDWVGSPSRRASPPEPGEETALLWRHPQTHRTMFLAAEERALLVLKMALEGLSVDQVVRDGGLDPARLRQTIDAFARDGLVLLRPPERG